MDSSVCRFRALGGLSLGVRCYCCGCGKRWGISGNRSPHNHWFAQRLRLVRHLSGNRLSNFNKRKTSNSSNYKRVLCSSCRLIALEGPSRAGLASLRARQEHSCGLVCLMVPEVFCSAVLQPCQCTHDGVYIYIYRERERERDR